MMKIVDIICIILLEGWIFIELMSFYGAYIAAKEMKDDFFAKNGKAGLIVFILIYLRISYILIHYLML